ncbi:hypothetical protein D1007_16755 [Hordeum vulgare]|nr:hypothetical protein D1007_16755 [Hordeum vulgare]
MSTMVHIFLHSLYVGLVSPFSGFLLAILGHCRIRLLHLQPNAFHVLALFVYLCEAFLGIMSFVALFWTFYSMKVSLGSHFSGGASLHINDEMCNVFMDNKI